MKKYKVTQEFMDGLETWRYKWVNGELPVNAFSHENKNDVVERWRFEHFSNDEIMKRLGALLNWINGEDVFEVGTPKYVVQLKGVVPLLGKGYVYTATDGYVSVTYSIEDATKFDDFEKASEWTNKHFEVVEAKEYENTIFEAVELDE